MSLFQGGESIQVNTSIDRAAEEEALADQRRHKEELCNLLQNAFDDLEADETTVDSTTNFQTHLSDEHPPQPTHGIHQMPTNNKHPTHLPPVAFEAEIHRLKMLLESQTRESEHFKKLASEEQNKRDELQKRLCIAEAELDRALASKKSTHELLVECKEKCSNLENNISKLREEKKFLENEHNIVLGKLETAQMLLGDVQAKYDMVERNLGKNSQRNAELQRKHMQERHRAEIEVMQQQMEQLSCKFDRKVSELESMHARYQALQSSHENMLVEKASKINDLNNALSEAQRTCEEFRARHDYQQENMRLQKFIASLQEQIKSMEKTIASLNERLEYTTAELDVMDSVLHHHNLEDTPSRLSQTQGKVVGSTPLTTTDRLGSLKEELYRALANIKGKREEIRRLQQSLDEKTTENRALREEENKALVQITTLKETNARLENRLKLLEQEYEELQHKSMANLNNTSHRADIEALQQQLKTEKQALREQCERLETECKNHEIERKKLDLQLRNVEVDLEELKQEHESMKMNYEQIMKENQNLRSRTTADKMRLDLEKHKFLLKDAQAECDRLKNLYIEISNAKEALRYEVDKLRHTDNMKELQEQREKVANLQRALQLAEVKSSELAKILETEKVCHERDVKELKERFEKEKAANFQAAKADNSNNCSKCIDYMSEITKFEIQNLKLSNINSINKKEIDDLTQQLNESKAIIAELNEKLKLTEQQEALIGELKTKAARFEEYVKSQSSASEPSPRKQTSSDEKGVNTEECKRLPSNEVKQIESRIRDEMAKLFASEIKRFQIKMHQTEEKNLCLQREYQLTTNDLQQSQTEVELLKQAILAEREHVEEILKQKDAAAHEMIEKQTAILHKCREELLAKNQRVGQLSKELEERQVQIEAERKSMKAVMSQWEEQRKHADAIESEWKDKVESLARTHEKALAAWQKKYNSAKHTAANYKRYAEDKEAHMLREYDRLKSEYDASVAKIEIRMREALEVKSREMKDAIASIEKRHELGYDKENKRKN
ncbi:golgin subfamily A member 6-like protein 24 isoform X1 [Anastrepha ludens]|uniref:golgin subfamily A member 6-like protein 24 isoform X1 n=1 Tax=Anastrepha ludens TaxID=28586 RepID=UPI0023B18690|nr:golgin subfamily A member 6-like protein 24 isoform X1 [Anastrepha ludens]